MFSVQCNVIGRCKDEMISQFSMDLMQLCMKECKDQRGCDFSSYSEQDKICALYKSCDNLDTSERLFKSSKWSCELPDCKYLLT